MLARSILVTGSNRGLGLELIKQLTKKTNILIATWRSSESASELEKIADQHRNVHIMDLDVTKHDTFGVVSEKVSAIVGDVGLNLLINNAGILVKPRKDESSFSTMAEVYETNTVSPLMLTEAFLPLLKKSSAVVVDKTYSLSNATVVNFSSLAGSLQTKTTENLDQFTKIASKTRDMYAYACSKAALNMAARLMAYELKQDNITVVNFHPGWVKTGMGSDAAPLTKEESIRGMIETMRSLTTEYSGSFLNYDGQPIPW